MFIYKVTFSMCVAFPHVSAAEGTVMDLIGRIGTCQECNK